MYPGKGDKGKIEPLYPYCPVLLKGAFIVIVAMSGGVDSSVTAGLLARQV